MEVVREITVVLMGFILTGLLLKVFGLLPGKENECRRQQ
jgi:hypothetical protein